MRPAAPRASRGHAPRRREWTGARRSAPRGRARRCAPLVPRAPTRWSGRPPSRSRAAARASPAPRADRRSRARRRRRSPRRSRPARFFEDLLHLGVAGGPRLESPLGAKEARAVARAPQRNGAPLDHRTSAYLPRFSPSSAGGAILLCHGVDEPASRDSSPPLLRSSSVSPSAEAAAPMEAPAIRPATTTAGDRRRDEHEGGGDADATSACASGKTSCAGACTDTLTDRKNCGKLRSHLRQSQVCNAGTCVLLVRGAGDPVQRAARRVAPRRKAAGRRRAAEARATTRAGPMGARRRSTGGPPRADGGSPSDGGGAPYCANLTNRQQQLRRLRQRLRAEPHVHTVAGTTACGLSCPTGRIRASPATRASPPARAAQRPCPVPDQVCPHARRHVPVPRRRDAVHRHDPGHLHLEQRLLHPGRLRWRRGVDLPDARAGLPVRQRRQGLPLGQDLHRADRLLHGGRRLLPGPARQELLGGHRAGGAHGGRHAAERLGPKHGDGRRGLDPGDLQRTDEH